MKGFIKDLWWMVLLRGLALLILGIVAVVWPGSTFIALVILFAVYLLVSGVMNILASISAIAHKHAWFITLLLGVIEIATGVYLLKMPGVALVTFVTIIGVVIMLQGILAIIVSSIDILDTGTRFLDIIAGVLGIIAGFIVLQSPVLGSIVFTWSLGVYGLIAGTFTIASALSLHQVTKELK